MKNSAIVLFEIYLDNFIWKESLTSVLVNNSNKTNNHLSPKIIEHKKDRDKWC
jgi:hypothetical protein